MVHLSLYKAHGPFPCRNVQEGWYDAPNKVWGGVDSSPALPQSDHTTLGSSPLPALTTHLFFPDEDVPGSSWSGGLWILLWILSLLICPGVPLDQLIQSGLYIINLVLSSAVFLPVYKCTHISCIWKKQRNHSFSIFHPALTYLPDFLTYLPQFATSSFHSSVIY